MDATISSKWTVFLITRQANEIASSQQSEWSEYTEGFKRFSTDFVAPLRFVHETVFKEEAPARYHLQSPPPSCKQTRVGRLS